ncbi:DUF2235 domain-containing protein [Bradyrhizobium sp. AUGA SZCCT0042]|uniref:DUF2235 domain-containing protein n=1 Tax=Bradyrhizobium sp. AUGA SZCCT0042 TaxID=2807651 RepID=UPI001BA9E21E|nr:DUF2235 domain-containing protein [Bradyrhizobium sp. AUGA SZCCT0042]MBR1297377.1 DUF2235 domain-containing protein [Bradyrhizobium sp. AUGA SZCCT0042]
MNKRIILLSDGTGNAAANIWRTNVWRTFTALDLSTPDQVACYDDGVGTSTFRPLAILGGVFGYGLKRNVLRLYKFACRNYKPSAELYLFGFSRGAFTVRVLAGLLASQGLVPAQTEAELDRLAKEAFREYQREKFHAWYRIGNLIRWPIEFGRFLYRSANGHSAYDKTNNTEISEIRFLGVWDTVAAYGLPMDEMTRGVSLFIWPLELPDRQLTRKVKRACHALALDDERTTFHPVLWTEQDEPTIGNAANIGAERFSQVWFSGAHANVGGGYPDDSLAHVPLYWMIKQAQACGLTFKTDPDVVSDFKSAQDRDGRLYDSRTGMSGYYRFGPRRLRSLGNMTLALRKGNSVRIATPKIHVSAFERQLNGAHPYAPIGIPERFSVVNDDGSIVDSSTFETEENARIRAEQQERVWNLVWYRRMAYFATLAASLHLLLFPLLYQANKISELTSPFRPVSELLRLVSTFLPSIAGWWINAFATYPGWFLASASIVVVLTMAGSSLGASIHGRMRLVWKRTLPSSGRAGRFSDFLLYYYRTCFLRRWTLIATKRYLLPIAWASLFLYFGAAITSHVAFNFLDASALFCRATIEPKPLDPEEKVEFVFPSNSLCFPTGISFERGSRYSVRIKRSDDWLDGDYDSAVDGYEISELPTWVDRLSSFALLPLRRVFLREWFRPIGRIGAYGNDEYFIDPPADDTAQTKTTEILSAFTARRSGEFFLYLNEAVIAFPRWTDHFYKNNKGSAIVVVQRLKGR